MLTQPLCSGYDVIGDVHGCARTLEELLQKLGYQKFQGVYRHTSRKVVFLGDIIDRGPHIRQALVIVKAMVDAGHAHLIIGNHEYNLLAYCTPAGDEFDRPFLREHNERNRRIVEQTLVQFDAYPQEFCAYLDWFSRLPLFLDFASFRAVHACWDDSAIDSIVRIQGHHCLTPEFLYSSAQPRSLASKVVDRLLRGNSLRLPDNRFIEARDGLVRHFIRAAFWLEAPETLGDIAFQPDPLPDDLAQRRLTDQQMQKLSYYGPENKPLFLGHYWLQGDPKPITPNIACLDYSAVKSGKLVAYRFDHEQVLDKKKYVWVDVHASETKVAF